MTDEEWNKVLRRVCQPTPEEIDEDIQKLNDTIRNYETEQGLTTEELRKGLNDGTIHESWDHCCWLMAVNMRDSLTSKFAVFMRKVAPLPTGALATRKPPIKK